MRITFACVGIATALLLPIQARAQQTRTAGRPAVVLVHGAFAESSSWDAVVAKLKADGYSVIAAANPLRSVVSDAVAIASLVRSIPGPVVLVGHSYGGPVITEAANRSTNVKALVYVSGFAPDTGETSLMLSAKFPGSTLGDSLAPVALPDGDEDLYIRPEKFRAQFAADVPPAKAAAMAATQRPVTLSALGEPSGVASWKTLPTYMIYGSADLNIPAAVMKFMADRAHARKAVVVAGASHAVMVSHPAEVTALIEDAAAGK